MKRAQLVVGACAGVELQQHLASEIWDNAVWRRRRAAAAEQHAGTHTCAAAPVTWFASTPCSGRGARRGRPRRARRRAVASSVPRPERIFVRPNVGEQRTPFVEGYGVIVT